MLQCNFPDELTLEIITYVEDYLSLLRFSETAHKFHRIAQDSGPWTFLIKKYFPYVELSAEENCKLHPKELFIRQYKYCSKYGGKNNLQTAWILAVFRGVKPPPVLSAEAQHSLNAVNGVEIVSEDDLESTSTFATCRGDLPTLKKLFESSFAEGYIAPAQYLGKKAAKHGHLKIWEFIVDSPHGRAMQEREGHKGVLHGLVGAILNNHQHLIKPILSQSLVYLEDNHSHWKYTRRVAKYFKIAADCGHIEIVQIILFDWISSLAISKYDIERDRYHKTVTKGDVEIQDAIKNAFITFIQCANANHLAVVKTFLWNMHFKFSPKFIEKVIENASIDALKAILVNASFKNRKKYHSVALFHASQKQDKDKLSFLLDKPVGAGKRPPLDYFMKQRPIVPQQTLTFQAERNRKRKRSIGEFEEDIILKYKFRY